MQAGDERGEDVDNGGVSGRVVELDRRRASLLEPGGHERCDGRVRGIHDASGPAADANARQRRALHLKTFADERDAAALALAAGQTFGARTPLTRLIEADVAFHSAIHVLSGNRAIVETVADQWPHFRRSMGLVLSVSGAQARYWDEHAAILEAILAGDATAAEQRARRHTAAAGEATARQLEAELSMK